MNYKELRKKFKDHSMAVGRYYRLKEKAATGRLSQERQAACDAEIARLSADIDSDEVLFNQLEAAKNPAWRKLSRELDTAMAELADPKHDPLSVGPMFKKFIGTMSLLIVGTWIIDGLRKK